MCAAGACGMIASASLVGANSVGRSGTSQASQPTLSLPEVKRTGSPVGKRTGEWQSPIRQAIAWARVTEFGPRIASSDLDASLRLSAQEDHEIRAFAGLGAQCFVRDDKGRPRRYPGDTIQCVRWNDNPVERALCTSRVRQHRLDVATMALARPALRREH